MGLFKKSIPPVEPYIPANERIYCIGDIHGCLGLLEDLHEKIAAHAKDYTDTKKLIYVGDYIDRGQHSKEVIDLMLDHPMTDFDITCLRGNHEQSMLNFLDDPIENRAWLNYGGLDTILSYGVRLERLPGSDNEIHQMCDQFETCVPDNHVAFLTNTEYAVTEGNYYFTHAGIRPGVPLDEQDNNDLLWIRERFVKSKSQHEKIIVHGHTIVDEVEIKPNRISIDTGAFATGKLSCLVLENDTQQILQTSR